GFLDRAAEACLDARKNSLRWFGWGVLMPLAFDGRERVAKPLHEAAKEPAIVLGGLAGRILFGDFAVQLVPVLPDRNEEHVHAPCSYDSTAPWRCRTVAIIRAWLSSRLSSRPSSTSSRLRHR